MAAPEHTAVTATLHVDAKAALDEFVLDVAFDVEPGRVVGVVGPNGAGKSTLLRTIAGLTPASGGSIQLGDKTLDDVATDTFVPVEQRPVSLVFQDYRLFPHLSVLDNVAFALRSSGTKRAPARDAAQQWLRRLDLTHLADRKPPQLSGGQAQRVALARALAADPQVLLLDEPLAALDAQTRLDVRGELRGHLAEFTGVCLLVTHDPLEALILADDLVVLEKGRVTQRGTPTDVARRPATAYVASLVGLNLYQGTVTGSDTVTLDNGATIAAPTHGHDGGVLTAFRPSAVAVYHDRPAQGSPRNAWNGNVDSIELLTDRVRLHVSGQLSVYVDVTPAAVADLRLTTGAQVWLTVKSTEIDVYPSPAATATPPVGRARVK
jgi:molybdate transport system ATP-binding protein